MQSKLVDPSGQPVNKQVTIEPDQALAIIGMAFDAQLGILLNVFKMPPPVLAENLLRSVAGLVAPCEPTQARQALLDQLIKNLRADVARRVGERQMTQTVTNSVLNGSRRQ